MDVILTFLAGILIGGVINALSDYLPYEPRQKPLHYIDGTRRPTVAWLGLSAFIFGKRTPVNASAVTHKLSWRYPLVELATALLMVLTLIASRDIAFMTLPQQLLYMLYVDILVLVFVIDVEHRLILFVVMIPAIVLALLDAILLPPPDISEALKGGALGFTVFFVLYLGGFLFTYIMGQVRGEEINTVAFGFGDVMLITFTGVLLGVAYTILAIFIAVFLGALGAFGYLFIRMALRGRYRLFTAIPYGPYIVIATLLLLLYGKQIWFYVFGYFPPA